MKRDKQQLLGLAAAMSAPLALCAGCGWGTILVAGVALLPLTCLPQNWRGMGKLLRWIEALWMGAVLGGLLRQSAAFWPSHEGLTVPLVLLALAFCTGGEEAPRVGAVLGFCLFVLYLPVAAAGAVQLEPEWLAEPFGQWTTVLPVVLLLPALFHGKGGKGAVRTAVIGAAFALLTQGVLSPWVAGSVETPFYQMARTLSPGGVSHIEPVISVAVTLGWYALAAGVLEHSEEVGRRTGRFLTTLAAIMTIVLGVEIDGICTVILCLILWIIVPFARSEKFFRKSEKRC